MAKKRTAKRKLPPRRTVWAPWVLAVDPGQRWGTALLERGELLAIDFGISSVDTVNGKLNEYWAFMQSHQADVMPVDIAVVLEAQFAGRDGKSNPKSLATLLYRRHIWAVLAEVRSWQVPDPVYPSSWQTVLRMAPSMPTLDGTKGTKSRSMWLARQKWPDLFDDDTPSDPADAACMGLFYTQLQAQEYRNE